MVDSSGVEGTDGSGYLPAFPSGGCIVPYRMYGVTVRSTPYSTVRIDYGTIHTADVCNVHTCTVQLSSLHVRSNIYVSYVTYHLSQGGTKLIIIFLLRSS